jgi:hypothetical protein
MYKIGIAARNPGATGIARRIAVQLTSLPMKNVGFGYAAYILEEIPAGPNARAIATNFEQSFVTEAINFLGETLPGNVLPDRFFK